MNNNQKNIVRILKTLAKIAGVFFVLALVAFFAFRNTLLQSAIQKIGDKLYKKYHLTLHVGEARFTGLASVSLHHMSLVPENRDTLLMVDTFDTGIRFWYALIGQIRIHHVGIRHGTLNLVNQNGHSNIGFLFHPYDSAEKSTLKKEKPTGRSLAKTVYGLLDALLDQVPSHVKIHQSSLSITDEKIHTLLTVDQLTQENDQLDADIQVADDNSPVQKWKINGLADPSDKVANVHFYNLDSGKVIIPYIGRKLHLTTGFDTIHLELDEVDMSGGILHIKGQAGIVNFLVNHPKISKRDVVVDNANVRYHFVVDEHSFALDSSTEVSFNRINFTPFVKLSLAPDTVFSFCVNIPRMKANDFIQSLPEGLFTHFKGMEVAGEFDYRLDFIYNENHPKDLVFESNLHKYNLSILRYGEANLSKLNGEFVHVPIERGRPMRPIMVGVSNPYYTPLDQISPYLQKCVLTTEDPSFFWHRGFIDEAFRQSIIKNIRQKRFARGASTISMQLVKNVFLTREKTMSRKLEEILLVYILENNRISSKERMLEVYFNIIEWGPNVYGIGEAAEFYFRKRPSQLTFDECLFLATIIPRPKGFMWRFDKEGQLKPFAVRQNTFLTKLMYARNLLAPEDSLRFAPIEISGIAKNLIRIAKDTLVQDTLIINENGIIEQNDE